MAYDTQPAAVAGARGEFVQAARLDDLASCHAALCALVGSSSRGPRRATRGIALYDHEEVGSRSAHGAAGPLLIETLERIASGAKGARPDALARALAHCSCVSADMAHAVHPNFPDRHEPGHRPRLGGGPVIKHNADQCYATDARTGGRFALALRTGRRLAAVLRLAQRHALRLDHRSDQRGSRRHPRRSTSATRCSRCTRAARWPAAPTWRPMIEVLSLFLDDESA